MREIIDQHCERVLEVGNSGTEGQRRNTYCYAEFQLTLVLLDTDCKYVI
jgi:hypothetical protein